MPWRTARTPLCPRGVGPMRTWGPSDSRALRLAWPTLGAPVHAVPSRTHEPWRRKGSTLLAPPAPPWDPVVS
eukprot:7021317-Prymnesium_polylepis.1